MWSGVAWHTVPPFHSDSGWLGTITSRRTSHSVFCIYNVIPNTYWCGYKNHNWKQTPRHPLPTSDPGRPPKIAARPPPMYGCMNERDAVRRYMLPEPQTAWNPDRLPHNNHLCCYAAASPRPAWLTGLSLSVHRERSVHHAKLCKEKPSRNAQMALQLVP